MKVPLPLDKHDWHPSVLVGQIVLVSTVDEKGRSNVAPKSWVTMVAFTGPIVAFGCNVAHTTYANVVATKVFVINILSESFAVRAWELSDLHGDDRRRESDLTLVSASTVRAPLIEECPAHLECVLDDVKFYGDEVMVFGRLVAASIDPRCATTTTSENYARLAPVFFLEDGTYAGMGPVRSVNA